MPIARSFPFLMSFASLEILRSEAAYATRYWDCCKAHCSWTGNLFSQSLPLGTCSKEDVHQQNPNIVSACVSATTSAAFTCHDNIPWAVNNTHAYGFAAVPATGDVCGSCFELKFTGNGQYGQNLGAAALKEKVMVVQATNIGYDVSHEQFDVMIPGGGVGAFDACSFQWGVSKDKLGVQYGGFLSACQQLHGHSAAHEVYKRCVIQKCDDLFGDSKFPLLHSGCKFFVDWYEVADNPVLTHRPVACPSELVRISGMQRKAESIPLIKVTEGPSDPVTMAGSKDCAATTCGCNWARKSTCSTDDGTECNKACCCRFRKLVVSTAPRPSEAPLASPAAAGAASSTGAKDVSGTPDSSKLPPAKPATTQAARESATTKEAGPCSCLWASDTTCAKDDDGTLCNNICCLWFRQQRMESLKNQTRPQGIASSPAWFLRNRPWMLTVVLLNAFVCL